MTNRARVLQVVQQAGWKLRHYAAEYESDREIVLTAVKQDGEALRYASRDLKNDREIVLAAVEQTGVALCHASKRLRCHQVIVLAAVKQNWLALGCASEELMNDREIVLAAVKQNGWALQHASADLRNDPDIVAAAITCEQHPCYNWTSQWCCGQQLKDLIKGALLALKKHGVEDPSDHPDFADTATIVEYAQQWKEELSERAQLAKKKFPEGVEQKVLFYTGHQKDLQAACDLIHCSPVIAADLTLASPQTHELLQEAQGRGR